MKRIIGEAPGAVIVAGFTFVSDDDEPNDEQARDAIEACRALGLGALRLAMSSHKDRDDTTLGLMSENAVAAALVGIGMDPGDASLGLVAAMQAEFCAAARAH